MLVLFFWLWGVGVLWGFTFWAKDFPYQREREGESTDGLGPSMIKTKQQKRDYNDIQ